jgi:hypothetical protein
VHVVFHIVFAPSLLFEVLFVCVVLPFKSYFVNFLGNPFLEVLEGFLVFDGTFGEQGLKIELQDFVEVLVVQFEREEAHLEEFEVWILGVHFANGRTWRSSFDDLEMFSRLLLRTAIYLNIFIIFQFTLEILNLQLLTTNTAAQRPPRTLIVP